MMSTAISGPVLSRSLQSRWVSVIVTTVGLAVMLLLTMRIYQDMDSAVYDGLPEGLRNAMGIPSSADPAVLALSVMLGTMGSMTLAAVALTMGAGLLAGEEADGTLRLLLATPMSRHGVVASKAVALIGLVAAMSVLLYGMSALVPTLLGVDRGKTRLAALCVHLALNTAFYGFMAFAIGAWTGRRGRAVAVTAGFMVLSFITVGLLPLFDTTKDLVGVIPWHWVDGHKPLVNGINWLDASRLIGGMVVFLVVALVGFSRRDLKAAQIGTTLVDRLRKHPLTRRYGDQIAGLARISSLESKFFTEHQGLLNVTSGLMFTYMGVLIGFLYRVMGDVVKAEGDLLSPEMLAMFGGAPMNTPEGFYQSETLGLMGPIAVILVGTTISVKCLAGHEREGRLGLALAYPVSRSRWLAGVAAIMGGYVLIAAAATGVGIMLGSVVGGLGMSMLHIAGTALHLLGLGLFYSAVALMLSAATGRTTMATWGTVALALVGHFWNAVFSVSPTLDSWARLSPFHYYLSSRPLWDGADWIHLAVLFGGTALLVAVAFPLFQRRDLRR